MRENLRLYKHHILAILTVIIWGATFVSSKILMQNGMTPATLLIYRFTIAYIGIWFVSPKRLLADSLKDELKFIFLGLFGGSLYFVTENSALSITQTSNVAIILAAVPLLTAAVGRIFGDIERLNRQFVVGSVIALIGVSLAVFNGRVILKLSPLGDALTLCSAFSWACYSILLKRVSQRYSILFITRKVFFYGLLTLMPFLPIIDVNFVIYPFSDPILLFNLLFLSVVASLICFFVWNTAVKEVGVTITSNYLYLSPIVSLITASIVLDEVITSMAIVGMVLILSGVYISSNHRKIVRDRR